MTVSFVSLCARSSRPVLGRIFNASLHSDHSQGNSLHSYRLASWLKHRSKRQQLNVTPRVDTINVKYVGPPGTPSELIMTKNISTPNDCAKHLSGHFVDRSAVALVNGVCWDLHKPLDEDCELTFLNFKVCILIQ
ncbi:unnamed protein product [Protopolystoma xenopodis]|uniref:TGS domain-containing protein n=1 Tax=Protopolystoma xenopodis TaxID=117903 RepID=A0A448X5P3_9PLAT|nr:unnamed protein product [Protopolystoma xenopodis]